MEDENTGRILLAVANPKQFLYAPFEMAIINMIMAIAFMVMCFAVLGLTPFWAMIPLVGGHITLVILGTINPHLTTTVRASGKYRRRRPNLVGTKVGVKYTP